MQEYGADAELLGLQFEVKEVCICSRQVGEEGLCVEVWVGWVGGAML